MACITTVQLVDDLDGGEAVESIGFELDGRAYDIDVSEEHAAQLREIFAPFVAAASSGGRVSAGRSRGRAAALPVPSASPGDGAVIREWATQNGFAVSGRGRIRSEVRQAYEQRFSGSSAAALPVDRPAVEAVVEPVTARSLKKVADPFTL